MSSETPNAPPSEKAGNRLDATTKAAQAIIDRETADREKKTARLRAARLAKEAADRETGPAS